MSDIYSVIGRRIREERTSRALSIEKLAEMAEVTPSFLGLIERGKRKLSVFTLEKISKALRISPNELMRIQVKRPDRGWENKISFLIGSLTKNNRVFVFKILKCLSDNLPR